MTKRLQEFIRILLLRISFTIFLAVTAWIHPATAFAHLIEPPQETINFPNYEAIRNSQKPVPTPGNGGGSLAGKKTDNGGRVLQPRKNLPPKNNQPSYEGKRYSKEEVIELIKHYSAHYSIDPARPLRIAKCESGYNQFAKNKSSSASGIFQFLNKTWASKPLAKQGKSVFDAPANVQTAVWLMSLGKWQMWQCK